MSDAPNEYSTVVETARGYYNSDDADNFYFKIWGGEDIHIGLYRSEEESIFDASRRTVESMASKLSSLGHESRVLDIGAGYGGAARYLAKTFGCHVVALNLSEKENERDREMNKAQGLDDKIEVLDASFEKIPAPDGSFDVVWSQDAILHSGERAKVMAEVARVLKPGGEFVFTDIMQVEDVDSEALQPVLDRIHLDSLGSLSFYRKTLTDNGMEEVGFSDHTSQLPSHYGRVLRETENRHEEIGNLVSKDYIDRMKIGLRHWVDAGNNGRLQWGILHFRKPA
ncbi:MAG: methyltransferase domain-containing protein [Chitinivibrionales bacterium]|nr:methyltransferase domain-containing protein [Chitinivibrionales bacterium]MBD3357568.1 methyltransferase domain-containing protein [Chitinivibrionales bacterium]